MKRKLLTALLVAALAGTTAMGIAACDKGHEHTFSDKWETNETQHWHKATCEHTDEKGSLGNHVYDNDADTDCNVCGYKRTVDNGSTDVFTAPTVNVLADPVEITAGEEFNYIEALDVSDEYDEADALNFSYTAEPELDLSDPAEGTYVLTITVTNSKGKSTTVTMNVTVTAPLPSLVVEVEKEKDEANWVTKGGHESGKMVFDAKSYIVIDENTPKTTEDGAEGNKTWKAGVVNYLYASNAVFHNTTDEPVVVHMQGTGGETAIFDSTGFMIEGRDGANGVFVNPQNPQRTSSTAKSYTYEKWGEVQATGNAMYMTIPAGGFAIVVSNLGKDSPYGYNPAFDTDPKASNFDYDGRGWLNKNVVVQYGTTVKFYFENDAETLLNETYTNHAPVLLKAPNVSTFIGEGKSVQDLKLTEGVTYLDDNNTFINSDDSSSNVTVTLVNETSVPAYDNNTEGTYVFTLQLTDEQGSATEFKRSVVVGPAVPDVATIDIGGSRFNVAANGDLAVNPTNVTSSETYRILIYTSYFTGTRFVGKFGFYFVVDASNKVREVGIPGGDRFQLGTSGNRESIGSMNNDDTLAPVKLAADEYVVFVLNQTAATNRRNEFRDHFTSDSNYLLGTTVTLYNIDYQPIVKIVNGSDTKTWGGSKVIVNQKTNSAATQKMLVYTKDYADTVTCNGYGCAFIINGEGKIQRFFDCSSAAYYMDAAHYWEAGNNSGGHRIAGNDAFLTEKGWNFDVNTYAQAAYKSLGEGEILIIFPHDGNSGSPDNPREFGKNFRQDFNKYTVTLENVLFD